MGNQHSSRPAALKLFTYSLLPAMKQNLDVSIALILPSSFPFRLPFFFHPHPLSPRFIPPSISSSPPSQVLLQQAHFAQNQRETFYLQVQLQQSRAGELPHSRHGQLSLFPGPEPLHWGLGCPGLQPRGTRGGMEGLILYCKSEDVNHKRIKINKKCAI